MNVAILDPSIASENIGDSIILESVTKELTEIFPCFSLVKIPTQDKLGKRSIRIARNAAARIVGGTNLLTSQMWKYRQWKVGILSSFHIRDVILMGVGWWQYQSEPDIYTRIILSRVLSKNGIHAARDEYTKKQLRSIGIRNVVNTGCPTMWHLSKQHCEKIPATKRDSVIFSLSDYKPDQFYDLALINILKRNYKKLFFWPQGSGDLSYLKSFYPDDDIEAVSPSLDAYDECLLSNELDFVGTRLHGGIRALQLQRRAIIIAVDNRAVEIARDTGLPVVQRRDIDGINGQILRPTPIKISLKEDAIAAWKSQFPSPKASAL
jgi:polysaccharide pyruvyl transferase WcaK-like protein